MSSHLNHSRRLGIILFALAVAASAMACSDDEGAFTTLPPIRTTTTTTTTTTTIPEERRFYVIQRGETLSIIAERFGVTVKSIMDLNGIENPDVIAAGQTIEIPSGIVVINSLPPLPEDDDS